MRQRGALWLPFLFAPMRAPLKREKTSEETPLTFEIRPAGSLFTSRYLAAAPYPFVAVAGRDAYAALEELRRADSATTPVIWGDAETAENLFGLYASRRAPTTADVLTAAAAGKGAALLAQHRDAEFRRFNGYLAEHGSDEDKAALKRQPQRQHKGIGALPEPHDQPMGYMDFATKQPREEVLIGLVPTGEPWQAAAYFRFGAWNDCPPPHVHVALARDWALQYGARLIVNTNDVLEFEVERPPATDEAAMALAELHWSYCNDTVDQGVGSLEALAHTLKNGRFWYFWWD